MGNNSVHIVVRKDIKFDLIERCKEEYLRHHPEKKGEHITYSLIIEQMCRFYLEN